MIGEGGGREGEGGEGELSDPSAGPKITPGKLMEFSLIFKVLWKRKKGGVGRRGRGD